MLATHFHTERLQHGLHGLYPKYSDYIEAIALLLGSVGFSVIACGIRNPGLVTDQCNNLEINI